jgi:hypothetical protein
MYSMRYDGEGRAVRDAEFAAALTVGGLEMAKMAGQIWRLQVLSTGTSFDAIHPAVNFILDYSGDFAATYLGNWILKDWIPRGSERTKQNIASGISLGAAVLVETLPVFGTPTFEDLGGAMLGIAAYRGLHWLLTRQPKARI